MSHLSILPTLLRNTDRLAASLESLGLHPIRGASLHGFQEKQSVDLLVEVGPGLTLGWRRQGDGCLALVGDLQRLSRSRPVQTLLGRITRAYAARAALEEAALHLPEAVVHLHG